MGAEEVLYFVVDAGEGVPLLLGNLAEIVQNLRGSCGEVGTGVSVLREQKVPRLKKACGCRRLWE